MYQCRQYVPVNPQLISSMDLETSPITPVLPKKLVRHILFVDGVHGNSPLSNNAQKIDKEKLMDPQLPLLKRRENQLFLLSPVPDCA